MEEPSREEPKGPWAGRQGQHVESGWPARLWGLASSPPVLAFYIWFILLKAPTP